MGMVKKQTKRLSDEIRAAVKNCGMSRYRIAKETGIDAAVLCRFAQGKTGITTDTLDKLAECIGLRIVADKPGKKKGG
jgi:ribosome-binding protein aMBF1 (putative translation factor)